MISALLNLWSNRHINRGFKQLEATTRASDGPGVLQLTSDHMLAFIDARLEARRLFRKDRQAAAKRGAETRRARA